MPESNLLTVADISQKYRISIHTLYYWIRGGRLRTVKIGRRHYIPETALFELSKGKAE